MEKIYVLGTGNALVTECFNTCFVLETDGGRLLVDCGGGNGILRQLKKAEIDIHSIHDVFLTHCHCDHFTGIVWIVRAVAAEMNKGRYEGNLNIWCHDELAAMVFPICRFMLGEKFSKHFDERIFVNTLSDGCMEEVCGHSFTFFDIQSTKAKQFGFAADLNCGSLVCMGDEPVNPVCEFYAENADWLLSEAFCLYEERETYHPYKKHHSTAKDAAELAEKLHARNLVLWHTEEDHLTERKALYTAEAEKYFHGRVFVPDDLEQISLED